MHDKDSESDVRLVNPSMVHGRVDTRLVNMLRDPDLSHFNLYLCLEYCRLEKKATSIHSLFVRPWHMDQLPGPVLALRL